MNVTAVKRAQTFYKECIYEIMVCPVCITSTLAPVAISAISGYIVARKYIVNAKLAPAPKVGKCEKNQVSFNRR